VIDIETDPFLYGRVPEAFAIEIYSDQVCEVFWGPTCVEDACEFLARTPGRYYAHNGGRFDFFHLIDHADHEQYLKIINGRIARMKIGEAVLVDSFLLAPFSLASYQKTEIDYRKFEPDKRERHKKEILAYLHDDCRDLLELITGFLDALGDHLTIGAAAFAKLRSLGFEPPRLGAQHDQLFRRFYFGGRTQAFKLGHWPRIKLDYFDINSAYPWAMLDEHPTGSKYEVNKRWDGQGNSFVVFRGRSRGVLPQRDDSDQLSYDDSSGWFNATGWELAAGLESGDIEIDKIACAYHPKQTVNFGDYVHEVYALRMAEKKVGNKVRELAFKFLLNSCYGKFATDPTKFKEHLLCHYADDPGDEWTMAWHPANSAFAIWDRPAFRIDEAYFDVATAASITGKVRGYMWSSLCQGEPYYCDTDSIIGKGYNKLPQGDELGQWKREATVKAAAIAGRKMYTVQQTDGTWKSATKGVRLTPLEVIEVAEGREVTYRQEAPTYSLSGVRFQERTIKST